MSLYEDNHSTNNFCLFLLCFKLIRRIIEINNFTNKFENTITLCFLPFLQNCSLDWWLRYTDAKPLRWSRIYALLVDTSCAIFCDTMRTRRGCGWFRANLRMRELPDCHNLPLNRFYNAFIFIHIYLSFKIIWKHI